MKLTLQKRLASDVMHVSPKRIKFDPARLEDVKEAITKQDVRALVGEGVIRVVPEKGVSRVRANKLHRQKRRGLRRGKGSRKGTQNARKPGKRAWINRVRSQRSFLKRLLENSIVSHDVYKDLYGKVAGGFFRSIKHIQIFMDERSLTLKKAAAKELGKQAAPAQDARQNKQKKN